MTGKRIRLEPAVFGAILIGACTGGAAAAGAMRGGDCCRNIQSVSVEATGLYCNMGTLTPAERARYKVLAEKLKAANVERREEATGYAFRFHTAQASLMDVAEWVNFERRCCPFFDFEIRLQPEGGPLWLKVTGREGVKQFISDEFGFGTRQVQKFEEASKDRKKN